MLKKIIAIIATLILLIIPLSGCSNTTSNNTNNNIMYLNSNKISNNGLNIAFRVKEDVYNKIIDIYIDIKNTNPKPLNVDFDKGIIYREKDNAEYQLTVIGFSELTLECDIEHTVKLRANIPTPIKGEKYYAKILNNKYILYLYNMPDTLKKEVKITPVINGKKEAKEEILTGTAFNDYTWISYDKLYFCNEWYQDPECKNKIDKDYYISEDCTVYGKQKEIYDIYQNGIRDAYYIHGFKYKPEIESITLPRTYLNKQIDMIIGTLDNCKYKKIYIPECYKHIEVNFEGYDYLNIMYEGNEERWNQAYKGHLAFNVSITFNVKI